MFWFLWCIAFNLLFHFPIHVYKGWDISGPGTKNLQALGLPLFFIKTLIVNTFLGVVAAQILLTYVLIYWLLPSFFYKKKNYLLIGLVTAGVLITFYVIAVAFKYSPVIYNLFAGIDTNKLNSLSMRRVVLIDQISSLPIVLGFALTITLVKRWWLKQKETELLSREKSKAELQLLKAQVHPHFLFNTLNNIYFFTLTNSVQAPIMIKKLTGLLNYILHECNQHLVPLEKEIKMLQDYVALEKLRYAEQMRMTVEIDGHPDQKMIAPLLLIPFVENSFKHGASKMISEPWVTLHIKIENDRLHFIIRNSQPQATPDTLKEYVPNQQGNIGLKNVKKRLALLYSDTYDLTIVSLPGSYAVHLVLPLQDMKSHSTVNDEIKTISDYALA